MSQILDNIGIKRIKYFITLFITLILFSHILYAQTDIILQDIIVGKAEVSATGSITLEPGFHAQAGSNFHAYIGTPQGQNSSTAITSPSSSSTPVSGSSSVNYVSTIIYREPKTIIPGSAFKNMQEISYIDGLGRLTQTVQVGTSPGGDDIIQPVLYDIFGRENKKTLPYTSTKSGAFITGVTIETVNNYYNSGSLVGKIADTHAYTETEFENSPINRVIAQTGPGSEWAANNKKIFTNYLTNSETKTGWRVTGNYVYTQFTYAGNTLSVNEIIDEDGNYSREYKDRIGQLVLKELKLGSIWLRTAYIYDDFGLLRCVVPPEADGPADDKLCYYYLYDSRKMMIEKKIPGAGLLKMVYDSRDRLRCTQNANQSANYEWTFNKYDDLNRLIITGTVIYSGDISSAISSASTMNETRNNTSANYGYTSTSFPVSGGTVLAVTYFDDYAFISGMGLSSNLNSSTYDAGSYNFGSITDSSPVGGVTGTMTKVLSPSSDAGVVPLSTLYSTLYYDKYGNSLRVIYENHLNGRDIISNIYEQITYQILQSKQEHYKGTEHVIIEKWFEYDHTGRLLATREKINDQPEITLNANKYNEVGELVTKYLHSNQTTGTRSFIQKEDFLYNIRGWLTKINDPSLSGDNDMFGLQMFYNLTSGLGNLAPANGLYNGNIVGLKWGNIREPIRGYQFSYDNLNRLLQSNYAEGSSLNLNSGYNSETITDYDKNSNIKGLQRKYNNALVDELTLSYITKSNQVSSVVDNGSSTNEIDDYPGSSQTYTYDSNGNMNYDGAKNSSIEYFKTINMPGVLDFGSNNRIFYHYSAGGAKLVKHVVPSQGIGTTIHYIGNFVYQGDNLSYIISEEGRIVPFGTGTDRKFIYEYNLKDHLGNNRVTFMGTDLGGAVDIVQTTSYYPFGLVMKQYNGNTASGYYKNKYLYNGKEIQDDKMLSEALNWYDYGARFYDPQIGRWHVIDPASELNRRWSPYRYAYDNPLRFIDPDGMLEELYINGNASDKATVELQKSTSLTLSRDDKTGKISATGEAKSDSDKKLLETINSETVKVEVDATTNVKLENGQVLADGAYLGNTLSDNKKTVTAKQAVNPVATSKMDAYYEKPGANMLHEVIEAYVGGEKAITSGVSGDPKSNYTDVHNAASKIAPQSGKAYEDIQNGVHYYFVNDGKKGDLIYNIYDPSKK